ncbi:hypothetical protein [Corallococcus sp. 4LFB]|uniref:hypothetical protein n=1 Tax=Corallococcus sp. 4LFB TaxID=3383249 RepID=UPI0039767FC5
MSNLFTSATRILFKERSLTGSLLPTLPASPRPGDIFEPRRRPRGSGQEGERPVIRNPGTGLDSGPCPQPLLAPLPGKNGRGWLSSDQARHGGMGTPPIPEDGRWPLPRQTALVLTSEEETKA